MASGSDAVWGNSATGFPFVKSSGHFPHRAGEGDRLRRVSRTYPDLECDPKALSAAMRLRWGRPAYLANVVGMSHRHDLDGAPVAELTAEEHDAARKHLDGIQAARQRARKRKP